MASEIIAYHGSNTLIKNFGIDFIGGQNAIDEEGPGVYFTNSKDDAMAYGNYIYSVVLTPRIFLSDSNKKGINR